MQSIKFDQHYHCVLFLKKVIIENFTFHLIKYFKLRNWFAHDTNVQAAPMAHKEKWVGISLQTRLASVAAGHRTAAPAPAQS